MGPGAPPRASKSLAQTSTASFSSAADWKREFESFDQAFSHATANNGLPADAGFEFPLGEVTGFRATAGKLMALTTNGGELAAETAVLAGGAWTGKLLEATGIRLPVKPVRGQMILFKGPPGLLRRMGVGRRD